MVDQINQTSRMVVGGASKDRASLALSAAGMGEFEWDVAKDRFIFSELASAITGVPAGAMKANGGESAKAFVHLDDFAAVRDHVVANLHKSGRFEVRFRLVRPDNGRTVWVDLAAVLIRQKGAMRRVIGVLRDITGSKAAEDEREALVSELDQRVKNVLASVQSLASRSARRTVSLDSFLKTFSGRLDAMAAAHTLLTSTRWRGAEIRNIAAAELGGLAGRQALWDGPEIILNPRATNTLTLALHELSTNAVKYGALSNESGRVDVRWRTLPTGGFELIWTETNGPTVTTPSRRGFGYTLLEHVTGRELGGEVVLKFKPEGMCATLIAGPSALANEDAHPRQRTLNGAVASAPTEHVADDTVLDGGAVDIAGVKVLIVEDAVLLALELKAGLCEAGAVVVGAAASMEEAERMLGLTFDAAVLDCNINGASVAPIAKALRARGIPFVFATGYHEPGTTPDGFDAPVVRKPYNVQQIAAALVMAMSGQTC